VEVECEWKIGRMREKKEKNLRIEGGDDDVNGVYEEEKGS